MTSVTSTSIRIRKLNDAFRRGGPASGRWVVTPGVTALGAEFLICEVQTVRDFEAFGPDSDPYGEHDFGAFDCMGEQMFWKIDYYDPSLRRGSEAPEDVKATARVLTIMLRSDY
jgi:hypothetical protein